MLPLFMPLPVEFIPPFDFMPFWFDFIPLPFEFIPLPFEFIPLLPVPLPDSMLPVPEVPPAVPLPAHSSFPQTENGNADFTAAMLKLY